MRRRRSSLGIAGLLLAIASSACGDSPKWGIPRVPVSAISPDGRYVAFVRNHPSIDPPSQSIWVGPREGDPQQIRKLAEDAEWCNLIAWSADSSTVVFLVQDSRVLAVDAASRDVVFDQTVTASNGEYPPALMTRNVSLSADGRSVAFRACQREVSAVPSPEGSSRCGPVERRDVRRSE